MKLFINIYLRYDYITVSIVVRSQNLDKMSLTSRPQSPAGVSHKSIVSSSDVCDNNDKNGNPFEATDEED